MKKADLIEVLTKAGFPKSEAEKMAADTADDSKATYDDAAKTKIVDEFRDGFRNVVKNDPEFINPIQAAEKAKQLDIVTRKLKATFGLAPDLIKDKPIEEVITIAKTESQKGLDKSVSDLQNELMEKNNRLKELEEVEIPKVRSEVDNHKKLFNKEASLMKFLGKQPLRVPIDAASPSLKSYLDENYDWEADEKGNISLYQKGTKNIALNADKTKPLTFEDVSKERLTTFQFLKESNGDDPKKKAEIQPEGDDKKAKVYAPGLDKAKEHLDSLKKNPQE